MEKKESNQAKAQQGWVLVYCRWSSCSSLQTCVQELKDLRLAPGIFIFAMSQKIDSCANKILPHYKVGFLQFVTNNLRFFHCILFTAFLCIIDLQWNTSSQGRYHHNEEECSQWSSHFYLDAGRKKSCFDISLPNSQHWKPRLVTKSNLKVLSHHGEKERWRRRVHQPSSFQEEAASTKTWHYHQVTSSFFSFMSISSCYSCISVQSFFFVPPSYPSFHRDRISDPTRPSLEEVLKKKAEKVTL